MTIFSNFTVEGVRNQLNSDSTTRWRLEASLMKLKSQGIDENDLIYLEFDIYLKLKCGPELAAVVDTIVSTDKNLQKDENIHKFQQLLMAVFDDNDLVFVKQFFRDVDPKIIFLIYTKLVPKEHQNLLIYYFIGKFNRRGGLSVVYNDFFNSYRGCKDALKTSTDAEKKLGLDMIFFHLYDSIMSCQHYFNNAAISEIYKSMINVTIAAASTPSRFTSDVLNCGYPIIPEFPHPSKYFHYPIRLVYVRFTKREQRLVLPREINEDNVSEALSTLNNHRPGENDVILLSIVHGLLLWKQFVEKDSMLLLVPANVVNMSPNSILPIWENFKGFPLKFDLDSLHKGIDHSQGDLLPLILSIKTTVFIIKKYAKTICTKNFFENFYSLDLDEFWLYMLNALLILGEYTLASNLLSLERDVKTANLIKLQIELGLGKISDAILTANQLILSLERDNNSQKFPVPYLRENIFLASEKSAWLPYVVLMQTHLMFLVLCKNHQLNNDQRDFILGDILIMSQLLYQHDVGETLADFISEILNAKKSFYFPGFLDYVCQSHIYKSLISSSNINFNLHTDRKIKSEFGPLLLEKLQNVKNLKDTDPLENAKIFIQKRSTNFAEIIKF